MCLQVGDLPPLVIPVHMVVVGCPISSLRTNYTMDQFQKEPVVRCPTPASFSAPLKSSGLPPGLFSSCPSTGLGPLEATQQGSPRMGCPGGERPQGTWLLSAHLSLLLGQK